MSSALYSTSCMKGASSLSLLHSPSSSSKPNGSLPRLARTQRKLPRAEFTRLPGNPLKLEPSLKLSFSCNGIIFNPLCLPISKRGLTIPSTRRERLSFAQQPRAASASEFSRQDSYGRRRGRSIEQPVPSTSGRSGLSNSNTIRSPSLGLFVERTKNAIHWSSKRPRPRATVIEKKLKRSLTGGRQRQETQAPGMAICCLGCSISSHIVEKFLEQGLLIFLSWKIKDTICSILTSM